MHGTLDCLKGVKYLPITSIMHDIQYIIFKHYTGSSLADVLTQLMPSSDYHKYIWWIIIRHENESSGFLMTMCKNGQKCIKTFWKTTELGTKFPEIRKFSDNSHASIMGRYFTPHWL